MCHLCSAGLPRCLVKLQFRDRLCIDTRIVQQPIVPGFRSQVCRLVKLKFRDRLSIDTRIVQQPIMPSFRCQVCRLVKLNLRDCLKHRFRSSQLLPNLHIPRR